MAKPKHIGIILDGNRRYAKRLGKHPWKGHEKGAENVEKLVDWAKELELKELTLYTFSVKNFQRERKEVDMLMKLFIKMFNKFKNDKRIDENKVKINFIGRIDMFPEKVQDAMKKLMEKTKDYNNHIINFAMGYDGRTELIDAVKNIVKKAKNGEIDENDVDEKLIDENVYMNDKPDMIIRTSGEKRISGFLLWQGSYSEFYFIDKMWPEFNKQDLINAITEFENRERRFGK